MIEETEIGASALSDHNLITLRLSFNNNKGREWHWKLNDSLLNDTKITQVLLKELEVYFEITETQEVSAQTIWKAHKAFVRGIFVKIGTRIKKKSKQLEDLLEKMKYLEN